MTFEKIHIGTAVLDLATNKLTNSEGIDFHVNHKSTELLRILSSRAGSVVGREELIGELFEGNHFSGDKRLSDEMYRARELLTRAGIGDVVLKTIPRKGYVYIDTSASGSGESDLPETGKKSSFEISARQKVVGLAAILAGAFFIAMYFRVAEENQQIRQMNKLLQAQVSSNEQIVEFFEELFTDFDPLETTLDEYLVRIEILKGAEEILVAHEGNIETRAVLSRGLGRLYLRFGMLEEAERHARKSVELNNELYGNDSVESVSSKIQLASVYRFSLQPDQARESYLSALESIQKGNLERHLLGDVYAGMGNLCLADQALCASGEGQLLESLEIRTTEFGKYTYKVFQSLESLGSLYQLTGDFPQAFYFYEEAFDVISELQGESTVTSLRILVRLATAKQLAGENGQALKIANHVESVFQSANGDHLFRGLNYITLANAYLGIDRIAEATAYSESALAYLDVEFMRGRPNSISIAFAQMAAGDVSAKKEDIVAATRYYEKSIERFSHYLGPEHVYTMTAKEKLDALEEAMFTKA